MPGFGGVDEIVQKAFAEGQFTRTYWNKQPVTVCVAGEWYDLYPGVGTPGNDGFTPTSYGNGTNSAFTSMVDGSGTVGIPHGGNVSPMTKHVLAASIVSAGATTAPAVFILVDILGYYPILNATASGASSINLTNPVTFPQRYSTISSGATGEGLQCYVVCSPGSALTPMGAFTPNITLTYTNSLGVSGRTNPITLPVGKSAATKGQIVYSGVAGAGKYGPFMPLAKGDTGISSIERLNISTQYGVTGRLNIVVCRPIFTLPFNTIGVAVEKDFLNIIPSLPRIYDGSVLNWLVYAGAAIPASSVYYGHIDFIWN